MEGQRGAAVQHHVVGDVAADAVLARLTTMRLNQMLNEIVGNGTDPFGVANAFVDTL